MLIISEAAEISMRFGMVVLQTCTITEQGGCLFANSFMSKVTPRLQDEFCNPFAGEGLSSISYLYGIIARIISE